MNRNALARIQHDIDQVEWQISQIESNLEQGTESGRHAPGLIDDDDDKLLASLYDERDSLIAQVELAHEKGDDGRP